MKSIKGDSSNDDLLESSSNDGGDEKEIKETKIDEKPLKDDLVIDDTKLSCLSYQPLNLDHLKKLNDKNTVRSLIQAYERTR